MADPDDSICPTCGTKIPAAAPQQMCPVCLLGQHDDSAPLPGMDSDEEVIGNYLILEQIGLGGMGVVYRAEHTAMRRQVALKVLSEDAVASASARQRFLRESEAVARLEHANIVRAFDAGEADGKLFLAMELVEGINLDQLVKDRGPLSLPMALDCISQAARGIAYAHSRHVIHRDIKPGNLILDNDGTLKVLDLGIARLSPSAGDDDVDIERTFLTNAEQIIGTIDFMSPEQALAPSTVDERADIYSLGITFWYLLTGNIPYDGETATARLLAHQQLPIPSLIESCPGIPAQLQTVFEKMVNKDREERFTSMTELLAALEKIPRNLDDDAARKIPHPTRQSRRTLHTVLSAVLLSAAAIYGLSLNSGTTDPPTQNPTSRLFEAARATELQRFAARENGVAVEIENSIDMKLRLIPAARFLRGTPQQQIDELLKADGDAAWQDRIRSETPQHEVMLSSPFYLGVHEVTQQQYQTVMNQNPSHFVPGRGRPDSADFSTAQFPVDSIVWFDAVTFCNHLSEREGLSPYYEMETFKAVLAGGEGYRLPTSAEWEFACRAGSQTLWHFGTNANDLGEFAWYEVNSGGYPQPVGTLQPNPFGLCDLYGNMWEWCFDWHGPYPSTNTINDPIGPEQGTKRSMRGGSFLSKAIDTRSAYRDSFKTTQASHRRGFRVAKSLARR